MKLKKTEWAMLICIAAGAILIALIATAAINEVREGGLKTIVDEIWCGEKGCKE